MCYDSWRKYIDSEEDNKTKTLDKIRKHTISGYPLGTSTFVKRLEKLFNKRLVLLPRGRPKGKIRN